MPSSWSPRKERECNDEKRVRAGSEEAVVGAERKGNQCKSHSRVLHRLRGVLHVGSSGGVPSKEVDVCPTRLAFARCSRLRLLPATLYRLGRGKARNASAGLQRLVTR